MAVFIFSWRISSLTFLIALWKLVSNCGRYSSPSMTISDRSNTRSRNRLHPLMLEEDQGAAFSKSPMNISYSRIVSAPY